MRVVFMVMMIFAPCLLLSVDGVRLRSMIRRSGPLPRGVVQQSDASLLDEQSAEDLGQDENEDDDDDENPEMDGDKAEVEEIAAEGEFDGVVSAANARQSRRRRSKPRGRCSAKDESRLKKHRGNGKDSLGQHSQDCGRSSYSIFTGLNKQAFNTCLRGKIPISSRCSCCYANLGQFSIDNCRSPCQTASSWCSLGCIRCMKRHRPTLDRCTGFAMHPVKAC